MSTFTFKWPKGPKSVVVTGDFDDWSKQCPLVEQPDGSFEASIPIDSKLEKIEFKFVIDDDKWLTSKDYKTQTDGHGYTNNVLYPKEIKAQSTKKQAFIPESGGIPVPVVDKKAEKKEVLKPAVEPVDKPIGDFKDSEVKNATKEQKTAAILSGPGIQIPNAENIAAFSEVRDVDPKTLNEAPEEPKKEIETPTVTKSEASKPEVTKPEVTKPEVTKPEVTKPKAVKAEVIKPEVTKPEVAKAEISKPEVTKPEVTKPEVTKPEVTKKAVEPTPVKAETKPASKEPETKEVKAQAKTEASAEPRYVKKVVKKVKKTSKKATETTKKVTPTKASASETPASSSNSENKPKRKGLFSKLRKLFC